MKVKKLINICKKSGRVMLFETQGGEIQWLGDDIAVYPLYELPLFDEYTLCKAYDITEKQAERIMFRHEPELPSGYYYGDIESGETLCEPIEMVIAACGTSVQPYRTSHGIMFIDRKYFQPLEDENESALEVYERTTAKGNMYFAIKRGFELLCIVMPFDIVNKKFVNMLREIYERATVVLESKESAASE